MNEISIEERARRHAEEYAKNLTRFIKLPPDVNVVFLGIVKDAYIKGFINGDYNSTFKID